MGFFIAYLSPSIPQPGVILSEVAAPRSEAATQSKDLISAYTVTGPTGNSLHCSPISEPNSNIVFKPTSPLATQPIQSPQAISVWRVLPVGTGRCLPNSRVA